MIAALQKYGIDSRSLDDLRPAEAHVSHSFDLVDSTPIYSPVRRLPPPHNTVVREELDKMLEPGMFTPAVSAWSFPVVIASKNDGRPRFREDYRALNKVMKAHRWPLPKIEELFDGLRGSKVFMALYFFTGYWKVCLSEECQEIMTFVCPFGTFQFEVMPF